MTFARQGFSARRALGLLPRGHFVGWFDCAGEGVDAAVDTSGFAELDSDGSQRMLNALEPGTVMPVHRHRSSSETVVALRGKIQWIFYDENGKETERVTLDANGDCGC